MLSHQTPCIFNGLVNIKDRDPQNVLTIVAKTRKEFTAIIACKMRDPLTSIGLSLELLESTHTDPGQEMYIDIIRRSNLQIDNLVHLLLKSLEEKNT